MKPKVQWSHGALNDLQVIDAQQVGRALPEVWRQTLQAMEDTRFAWPAFEGPVLKEGDAGDADDAVRRANLLNWRPDDGETVIPQGVVGADELVHMAIHRQLYAYMGRSEDRDSWLLCEAVASAADIWLLGAMLGTGQRAEFLDLQAEVWSQCWADAGRSERELQETFERVAGDPSGAFVEMVSLLEGCVTALIAAKTVRESASVQLHHLASPLGPLLLHFQVDWWTQPLRARPAAGHAQASVVTATRSRVTEARSPVLEAMRG